MAARNGETASVSSRASRIGMLTALAVVAADQASKWWIVETVMAPMAPPREIVITPFFSLVMVWNRGITFGIFADGPGAAKWVLSAVSLVIVVILAAWLVRASRPWVGAAIGAVIGGAVGNVIDRFRYGAVADFLDFHIGGWHWPAFNLADSAIVIGVMFLLVDAIFAERK